MRPIHPKKWRFRKGQEDKLIKRVDEFGYSNLMTENSIPSSSLGGYLQKKYFYPLE